MKNAVLWNVTPSGSCNNRLFEGTKRFHHQGDKNRRARNNTAKKFLRSVLLLLVTANVVPISQVLVTVKMEGLSSSETSVLTRTMWRNIPEDGIFHLLTYLRVSPHERNHDLHKCV
jgi:hypothetical protein